MFLSHIKHLLKRSQKHLFYLQKYVKFSNFTCLHYYALRYNVIEKEGGFNMGNHTASQVAKWFLAHNRNAMNDEGAEYISNLKLQKLLYYAQGSFLAVTGDPLFNDDIVAWQHGPVVESIYHQYKSNGANGIIFDEDFDFSVFSKEENELLTEVYDTFGQYSAWKLRNMTHSESPWLETPQNGIIPKEKIKEYFKQEYLA